MKRYWLEAKKVALVIGVVAITLFITKKVAKATPGTRFPDYLQNTIVARITGCMNWWLQRQLNFVFRDDGTPGSGDELCPPGQHIGGGSFSGVPVPCGWKTLNLINALIMDMLDKQPNTPVECCCNPADDPSKCTGPATSGCPVQFPNRGKCVDLKPEATNYYVIQGYQSWALTEAATNLTDYWSGLLDMSLPVPIMGTLAINLTIDDVCNGITCGPPAGFVANSQPGYCGYPPPVAGCGGSYQSNSRDRFIIGYNPNSINVNFSIGQSSNPCGWPGPVNYNGKTFTGNEGFITIELQMGSAGSPVRIDIDAVTPSAGNVITFTTSTGIGSNPANIAPGDTDCNPNSANWQGDCYVRAYLQASGAIRLKLGATAYLEHRTDQTPHMQGVGLAIREINFADAPWISLQLDWRWTEQSGGCTNTTVCTRRNITIKAAKTIEFIDLVLRGLFRYDLIPVGLRQYFGPVVVDITDLVQSSIDHLVPTWSRPLSTDSIKYDISIGGPPFLSSNILRSMSCFANNGVGPTGNQNELYLIGAGMIDLDLYRRKYVDDSNHLLPSCGYLGTPTHPAFTPASTPTGFANLPHVGRPDSAGLASCDSSGTFVGISFHQNIFSYLVSDVAASGIMCLALSEKGEGFASSLPLPIWTVGQMRLLIPELYTFLEKEFGPNVTDIPVIFVIKPKPHPAFPGFPNAPGAIFIRDDPPQAWSPLPITGDVLLTLPNNDVEIWIDVDNVVEQWGYGPLDTQPNVACSYSTPVAGNWCASFGTGTTPPVQWLIPRPPAGNTNDFVNNFPDCVSFIDCDTNIGNPSDRAQERRFIAQFNVGITMGLDLNFFGCGRGSGKVFGNLPAWGFSTTWYNPWNPATAGNCTTVSHLRRLDLTAGFLTRLGSVSVYNDATVVRVYYPFSNNTFFGYIGDLIAVMLSGELALDAQVGYTLSAILDPNDNLYSATPANNNVVRIGGHTKGGTADRLTYTFITRDDVGANFALPNITSFLTIAIDLQGDIHPNFFYGLISQLLSGSADFLAPPFGASPFGASPLGTQGVSPESFGALPVNGSTLKKITKSKLDILKDIWDKVKEGEEALLDFGTLRELVGAIELGGYVIPLHRNGINGADGVDDFPPEVQVLSVEASTPRTIIKLSCVDDMTKPDNCWYSWRFPGKIWFNWQTSDEIELRGLPDGIYTIEVRALDERGIPDITPQVVRFVVDDNAPSVFFPKNAEFRKGDIIEFKVWDYITSPGNIKISWAIEGEGAGDGVDVRWTEWALPDAVSDGLGVVRVRAPYQEGYYTLFVKTKDEKGNEEIQKFPLEVKSTKGGVFGCGK